MRGRPQCFACLHVLSLGHGGRGRGEGVSVAPDGGRRRLLAERLEALPAVLRLPCAAAAAPAAAVRTAQQRALQVPLPPTQYRGSPIWRERKNRPVSIDALKRREKSGRCLVLLEHEFVKTHAADVTCNEKGGEADEMQVRLLV